MEGIYAQVARSGFWAGVRKLLPTLFLLLSITGSTVGAQTWEQTNGPYGGNVFAIIINSSGHIFAGSWLSGIYRSIDDGENWVKTWAQYPNVLAVNDNDHLFAGTPSDGIFRSTDNGENWEQINDGLSDLNITAIVIDSGDNILIGTADGVCYFSDNGDNWDCIGLNGTGIQSLAVNVDGHIFAGTFGDGLYRSNDNGSTWVHVDFGLDDAPISIHDIAINPDGDIFTATPDFVYRSTDNGDTWDPPTIRDLWCESLAINSNGHIFAGTFGDVYRSTDNGDSWISVGEIAPLFSVLDLLIDVNDRVFAGVHAGGGVLRSTDNGDTWIRLNNGMFSDIEALAVHEKGIVFAASYDIHRSLDTGVNWIKTGVYHPIFRSLAINNAGVVFAASCGIHRSTDDGISWSYANAGLTTCPIWALCINNEGDLFAGIYRGGMFRSTDDGESWTEINTGLTSPHIRSLAITENGDLFAGTVDGIFRSTNNGNSWTHAFTDMYYIDALAINEAGDIFAGDADGNIFRSVDNGDTWVMIASDSGRSGINELVISDWGTLFAGTQADGVYYSTDNGNSWNQMNDGLTNLIVMSLEIGPGCCLFAGTAGGGVFRTELLRCGDPTHNCRIDISDAVYIVAYLFNEGPEPDPLEAADANCDGTVDSGDAVYLINYIFKGGPVPCCP